MRRVLYVYSEKCAFNGYLESLGVRDSEERNTVECSVVCLQWIPGVTGRKSDVKDFKECAVDILSHIDVKIHCAFNGCLESQ